MNIYAEWPDLYVHSIPQTEKKFRPLSIAVLGCDQVGKTSLLVALLQSGHMKDVINPLTQRKVFSDHRNSILAGIVNPKEECMSGISLQQISKDFIPEDVEYHPKSRPPTTNETAKNIRNRIFDLNDPESLTWNTLRKDLHHQRRRSVVIKEENIPSIRQIIPKMVESLYIFSEDRSRNLKESFKKVNMNLKDVIKENDNEVKDIDFEALHDELMAYFIHYNKEGGHEMKLNIEGEVIIREMYREIHPRTNIVDEEKALQKMIKWILFFHKNIDYISFYQNNEALKCNDSNRNRIIKINDSPSLPFLPFENGMDTSSTLSSTWWNNLLGSQLLFFNKICHTADSLIFVYDVTNIETLNNLVPWLAQLHKIRPDIPILLIGNKIDLLVQEEKEDINLNLHEMSSTLMRENNNRNNSNRPSYSSSSSGSKHSQNLSRILKKLHEIKTDPNLPWIQYMTFTSALHSYPNIVTIFQNARNLALYPLQALIHSQKSIKSDELYSHDNIMINNHKKISPEYLSGEETPEHLTKEALNNHGNNEEISSAEKNKSVDTEKYTKYFLSHLDEDFVSLFGNYDNDHDGFLSQEEIICFLHDMFICSFVEYRWEIPTSELILFPSFFDFILFKYANMIRYLHELQNQIQRNCRINVILVKEDISDKERDDTEEKAFRRFTVSQEGFLSYLHYLIIDDCHFLPLAILSLFRKDKTLFLASPTISLKEMQYYMLYDFKNLFSHYRFRAENQPVVIHRSNNTSTSTKRYWFLFPLNVRIFRGKRTLSRWKEADENYDIENTNRKNIFPSYISVTGATLLFILFTSFVNHPYVKQPLIDFIYSYSYPLSQQFHQMLSRQAQSINSIEGSSNSRFGEQKRQILSWIKSKRDEMQLKLEYKPPTTFTGLLPPLLAIPIQQVIKTRSRDLKRIWKHLSIEFDYWGVHLYDNLLSVFNIKRDRNIKLIKKM